MSVTVELLSQRAERSYAVGPFATVDDAQAFAAAYPTRLRATTTSSDAERAGARPPTDWTAIVREAR